MSSLRLSSQQEQEGHHAQARQHYSVERRGEQEGVSSPEMLLTSESCQERQAALCDPARLTIFPSRPNFWVDGG